MTKICPHCTKELPLNFFANKLSAKDGKASWCKSCTITRTLQSRKEKPLRHRFNSSKSVAKRKGLEWNLSFSEFSLLTEKECFYCEKPLNDIVAGSGLDRIDNERGYTLDNVLPCCGNCNKTRNNIYTVEETKVMIMALLDLRRTRI
jgi:hypothetical protein